MKSYVCGLLTDFKKEKIILIEKNRPLLFPIGSWNLIGGSVEQNESPNFAMQREFFEETNYFISAFDWTLALELYGKDYKVYFFKCQKDIDLEKSVETMTDEVVKVYDLKDLPKKIVPNLKWMIPFMLHDDNLFPMNVYVKN